MIRPTTVLLFLEKPGKSKGKWAATRSSYSWVRSGNVWSRFYLPFYSPKWNIVKLLLRNHYFSATVEDCDTFEHESSGYEARSGSSCDVGFASKASAVSTLCRLLAPVSDWMSFADCTVLWLQLLMPAASATLIRELQLVIGCLLLFNCSSVSAKQCSSLKNSIEWRMKSEVFICRCWNKTHTNSIFATNQADNARRDRRSL